MRSKEDIHMSSMNFAEATEYVVDSFFAPSIFKPILLMGNQGIGKSAVAKVAAEIMRATGKKVRIVDKRLASCDAGDIMGIPYNDAGTMRYAKGSWFPAEVITDVKATVKKALATIGADISSTDPDEYVILFLDEVNRAPRDVQQAVFQLVYDRCLDDLLMSSKCVVMSAMNDNSDLYQTVRMDPAFLDRFFMAQFKPSDTEWLSFMDIETAAGRGHNAVPAFLKGHPTYVDPSNQMIEESTEKNTKTFSRRSWSSLSAMLRARCDLKENDVKDWDVSYLVRYCSCMVGVDAGTKLARFIENEYQTLDPKEVLKNYTPETAARIRKARTDEQTALAEEIVKLITDSDEKKFTDKIQLNVFKLLVDFNDEPAKMMIESWNKKKGAQLLKFLRRADLGEVSREIGKDSAGNVVIKTYKKPLERQTDMHAVTM